jgi:hypothetical protein
MRNLSIQADLDRHAEGYLHLVSLIVLARVLLSTWIREDVNSRKRE